MNNQAKIRFDNAGIDPVTNQHKVGVTVENNYENGQISENMISWVDAVMDCVDSASESMNDYEIKDGCDDGATILLTESGQQMNFDLMFDGEGVTKDTVGSTAMALALAVVEEFGNRVKASQNTQTQ